MLREARAERRAQRAADKAAQRAAVEQFGRKRRGALGRIAFVCGRALVWVGRLATAFIVLTSLWVFSYRFVDPPATLYILMERERVGGVDWRFTPIERVSPELLRAIVAAEDSGFCEHGGVEVGAVLDALADWRETGRLRGGSTITQQTAKNLFLWPERSMLRKGLEAWFAGLMELFLPKERILELYVNVAEFDEGVFGVEAASQDAFGLSADGLSLWRATRIAVLLPAPQARDATDLSPELVVRADRIADGARTLENEGRDGCFVATGG